MNVLMLLLLLKYEARQRQQKGEREGGREEEKAAYWKTELVLTLDFSSAAPQNFPAQSIAAKCHSI